MSVSQTARLFYLISFCLSSTFFKHFWVKILLSFRWRLGYFIISHVVCQQLFYFSLLSSVWHLRFSGVSHTTAIIDYHNFNSLSIIILIFFATHFWVILLSYDSLSNISQYKFSCQQLFLIFFWFSFDCSFLFILL